MNTIKKSEETNHDRRSFLRTAAMTIAAAQVGRLRSADAQSPKAKPAGVPTIKPGGEHVVRRIQFKEVFA
jgi:hypothetical protein